MKYLKKFNNKSDYDNYTSSELIRPNVSYIVEEDIVEYNPLLSYNMVDLGLPSGLKWADRNIGAANINDEGLYFQWGGKKGYNVNDIIDYKVILDENNYFDNNNKYYVGNSNLDDRYNTLDPEDDAATIHMGRGWRMPNTKDFNELINNTEIKFINKKGEEINTYINTDSKAVVLISKLNGNKLILPYGIYEGESTPSGRYLKRRDNIGEILSSNIIDNNYAETLTFGPRLNNSNQRIFLGIRQRYFGTPIRGVHV